MKIASGKSRQFALDSFRQELTIANASLQNMEEDDILGMIYSVQATIKYLNYYEETHQERLTDALVKLMVGLVDLKKGNPPEFLKRTNATRASGLLDNSHVGFVVGAVDLLKDTGMKVEDACTLVAKVCQKAGIENKGNSRKNITPTTVKNWRSKVSEDIAFETAAGKARQVIIDNPPNNEHPVEIRRAEITAYLRGVLNW